MDRQFIEMFPREAKYIQAREGHVGPARVSSVTRDSVLSGLGGEAIGLAVSVGYCGRKKPCSGRTSPQAGPERVSLCWGDPRRPKIMYNERTYEVVALLDWEMAFPGDPEAAVVFAEGFCGHGRKD